MKGGTHEEAGLALTPAERLPRGSQSQGPQHWEGPGVSVSQECWESREHLGMPLIFTARKHGAASFRMRKQQRKHHCDANF